MNIVLFRYSAIAASLAAIIFLFARFAPGDWVKRMYRSVKWLLEITYLYFVDIVIFLKPLKKHREKVGLVLWLFFVYLIGRYMIVEQPLITEIRSHFLPFIGYIYLLSVLYMIKIIFELTRKGILAEESESDKKGRKS